MTKTFDWEMVVYFEKMDLKCDVIITSFFVKLILLEEFTFWLIFLNLNVWTCFNYSSICNIYDFNAQNNKHLIDLTEFRIILYFIIAASFKYIYI